MQARRKARPAHEQADVRKRLQEPRARATARGRCSRPAASRASGSAARRSRRSTRTSSRTSAERGPPTRSALIARGAPPRSRAVRRRSRARGPAPRGDRDPAAPDVGPCRRAAKPVRGGRRTRTRGLDRARLPAGHTLACRRPLVRGRSSLLAGLGRIAARVRTREDTSLFCGPGGRGDRCTAALARRVEAQLARSAGRVSSASTLEASSAGRRVDPSVGRPCESIATSRGRCASTSSGASASPSPERAEDAWLVAASRQGAFRRVEPGTFREIAANLAGAHRRARSGPSDALPRDAGGAAAEARGGAPARAFPEGALGARGAGPI